jgi:hypothetical protein
MTRALHTCYETAAASQGQLTKQLATQHASTTHQLDKITNDVLDVSKHVTELAASSAAHSREQADRVAEALASLAQVPAAVTRGAEASQQTHSAIVVATHRINELKVEFASYHSQNGQQLANVAETIGQTAGAVMNLAGTVAAISTLADNTAKSGREIDAVHAIVAQMKHDLDEYQRNSQQQLSSIATDFAEHALASASSAEELKSIVVQQQSAVQMTVPVNSLSLESKLQDLFHQGDAVLSAVESSAATVMQHVNTATVASLNPVKTDIQALSEWLHKWMSASTASQDSTAKSLLDKITSSGAAVRDDLILHRALFQHTDSIMQTKLQSIDSCFQSKLPELQEQVAKLHVFVRAAGDATLDRVTKAIADDATVCEQSLQRIDARLGEVASIKDQLCDLSSRVSHLDTSVVALQAHPNRIGEMLHSVLRESSAICDLQTSIQVASEKLDGQFSCKEAANILESLRSQQQQLKELHRLQEKPSSSKYDRRIPSFAIVDPSSLSLSLRSAKVTDTPGSSATKDPIFVDGVNGAPDEMFASITSQMSKSWQADSPSTPRQQDPMMYALRRAVVEDAATPNSPSLLHAAMSRIQSHARMTGTPGTPRSRSHLEHPQTPESPLRQ